MACDADSTTESSGKCRVAAQVQLISPKAIWVVTSSRHLLTTIQDPHHDLVLRVICVLGLFLAGPAWLRLPGAAAPVSVASAQESAAIQGVFTPASSRYR